MFGLNLLLLKLKTENWKHCSKIIFKCVNSTVRPIFNIFFMNKVAVGLINSIATVLLQYCYSTATVLFVPSFLQNAWNEKKKKRRRQTQVSAESKRHHRPHSLFFLFLFFTPCWTCQPVLVQVVPLDCFYSFLFFYFCLLHFTLGLDLSNWLDLIDHYSTLNKA